MSVTRFGPLALALLLLLAPPAGAANREHQLMMAEIRMLQEQSQQLQLMIATLADSVKQVATKLDDQSALSRKAFADQKVLVDNVADGVRILREKVDETNVRISSLTQEMEALRLSIPASPPAGTTPPVEGTPAEGMPTAPSSPTSLGATPQQIFQEAFADYTAGQWDLAISGFQHYLKSFPKLPDADEAQLYIGESHYAAGRFQDAVKAYNDVIVNHPTTNSVPQAMYKLGLTYERMGETDRARQILEALRKKYPDSEAAIFAKQTLDRLSRPKQ